VFPSNEINKGVLTMQLKRLRETQEGIEWPSESRDLPVVGWDECESLLLLLIVPKELIVYSPRTS